MVYRNVFFSKNFTCFLALSVCIPICGCGGKEADVGSLNIVKESMPIKGHIVAGIGYEPSDIISRSHLEGQDIESSFRVFRGSPSIYQGVSFNFEHEKYAFSIPYALYIGITSLDKYGEAPLEASYKELIVDSITIRKIPIYANFDSAYQEFVSWEKFFLGLGFKKTKIEREYTYDEAKERSIAEIRGNKFPTYYVGSGRADDLTYAIGIDRSENKMKTSKYGYNINLTIARYPSRDSFWKTEQN